ncbi:Retrotransposon-like protein 1 [Fusarium oxysporum f. sp. raphani]|uniref:Retrotransposon-like protein 1 n=2 Tax=Fusarium oxysporum f. sp. raphani TaxID=96318 RepID=A0A8J5PN83_FUSOX|nr:Retrotransposon-like protein 1 [Fusarium oxysporum f. sp. raphani]
MSSNANTGPAPPYTGAPPSNAEMAAEVQQLRNTIRTLQAQMNARPAATNNEGENPVRFQRDIGEALKPPKPEPFTGKAADVIPFLTRMKAHFRLFPNRLDTATKKVLYTSPLIQGDAKDWWEPIMRDFLENEEPTQEQDTQNIFADWDNFEQALKDNFGVVNEERQAAAELLALKQHKSCAAYSAKFRQLASKTEWDDEALMEIYYRGLKEEVKDELYLADRPDDLTTYITMAIKIDERQYERRREKANHKRGNDFNPYYPNQRRNDNHQGNSRNKGQRRGNYRNDTSHGAQPGPMVLGAIQPGNNHRQRDMSRVKCYNCNKHGHIARDCPEPRRARDPNQGKQTLGLTKQQDPQMAIRTQTLGVIKNGYDTTGLKKTTKPEWKPHPDSSIREPQDPFLNYEDAVEASATVKGRYAGNIGSTEFKEKKKQYYAAKKERVDNDPALRERINMQHRENLQKKRLGEPQTLGVIREGKINPPKKGKQAQSSKAVDDIPTKTTTQRDGSTITVDTEKGYITKYEAPRFAMTTLQKKEEAVKKEREAETKTRTYHHRHPRITIPGTPNDNPYHEWETYGYSVYHWHENLGVATLRFNLAYYRQIHKTKELLEGIKHSQQLIEEAEKEFEEATQGKHSYKKEEITKQLQDWEKEYQEKMANGQYDHLMKKQISIEQIGHPINWPSTDNASSDTTEELQGQWEDDGLHLRNDPVDLQRLNEITTTEDTDSDESSLEKEHIFEPIDLKKGFDQVLINDEQSGQGITPEDRDAELEEHFQQQLFDEEFINDCPNGEGCNDSECEQTHRDASGKVTRHL